MLRRACIWPLIMVVAFCWLAPVIAEGAPVQWATSAGGNGHWYEAVLVTGSITWDNAKAAALARGGYLVTITSAAENAFAYGLVSGDSRFWYPLGNSGLGPWLGGIQQTPCSPEPSCGWTWANGEPWGYTAWSTDEPNNNLGNEDAVHFYSVSTPMGSAWNDITRSSDLGL